MEKKRFTTKKFGPITKRQSYSKSNFNLEVPNLLNVQIASFEKFCRERIRVCLKDIYPIKSKTNNISIQIDKDNPIEFKRPTSYLAEAREVAKAIANSTTYQAKLFGNLQKYDDTLGVFSKPKKVIFAEVPLMTSGGFFVVNGVRKVVISQLVKSPGVYYQREARMSSKESLYNIASLNPFLGSWIKIFHSVTSKKIDFIRVKIDKSKNLKLLTFLKAFGISNGGLKELFGTVPGLTVRLNSNISLLTKENQYKDALEKLLQVLRPGDRLSHPAGQEVLANLFFSNKRYDLSNTGRYMLNRKLCLSERIEGTYLAEDITSKLGTILFKAGTWINGKTAKKIQDAFDKKLVHWTKIPDVTKSVYPFEAKPKNFTKIQPLRVPVVYVYPYETWLLEKRDPVKVIGNNPNVDHTHLLLPDLIAMVSYYFNLLSDVGNSDEEDSLVNKRVWTIGELLENQLRIGLSKMQKASRERLSMRNSEKLTVRQVTNSKPVYLQLKSFFNSSKLCQFMDQVNPLAEISNKRRITAVPPGVVSSRENVPFSIRNVHTTHYGRICPIESPEGPNIGLVLNFATYAQVDKYGFILTPYFPVKNGVVDKANVVYLNAFEERNKKIGDALVSVKDGRITGDWLTVRYNSEFIRVRPQEIDLIDVSSKQFTSVAAGTIPFLENDDANRALMGSNMQRQAVPLLQSETPFVATGIESVIAKYSANNICVKNDGQITFVDANEIRVKENKSTRIYKLSGFQRSNQGTVIHQKPIVKTGQTIKEGDLLVDGSSFCKGELSLGKNVLVAFSTWNGYNYEDAIILSERLVKDDVFTSIHIEVHTIKFCTSKIGDDKLTTGLPNVSNYAKRFLDTEGIVIEGSEVSPGDVLVGRTSPKGETNPSPEERLIAAIFSERSKNIKNTSLKVHHGEGGTVIKTKVLSRENGDKLDDGVNKVVKVYVAQKRKIKVGDKMAGRHGNKGVVSIILPVEDMPHLPDGTPVDMMLNPLGVPSRMNIGQVLELHLGMAAKLLNVKFVTPVFDGLKRHEIQSVMKKAEMPSDGKFNLFDPISGEKFASPVAVGYMYMLKLAHMVDDKMHARSVGPYSLISQQPLGGKSQNGGQRFGEMETWALESYGASNVLQEMLTYKSDDIVGRNRLYNAVSTGTKIPRPERPESFNVLAYELRGLCLKPEFISQEEEDSTEEG